MVNYFLKKKSHAWDVLKLSENCYEIKRDLILVTIFNLTTSIFLVHNN